MIVSRQIGHLLNNFAQLRHEAICPHSINAQLASASKQILHASAGDAAVESFVDDEGAFEDIENSKLKKNKTKLSYW